MSTKILYWNNCWFTNVGEAFIDIGAMEQLKRIFPNANIANVSSMSHYYTSKVFSKNRLFKKTQVSNDYCYYDPSFDFSADYIVISGMFATKEFVKGESAKIIKRFVRSGAKLILLGIGGVEYTEDEFSAFKEFIEETKPLLLTSRDNETFEAYKNDLLCIKSIDSALWVNNVYKPLGFSRHEYDIVSFNRSKEPDIFNNWKNQIIRPFHFQASLRQRHLTKNIVVSDTPYDYLTIYANAHETYTDLVHATLISIGYGVPVKYFHDSKRSYAFNAISNIYEEGGFLKVGITSLEAQKDIIIEKIRNSINNL